MQFNAGQAVRVTNGEPSPKFRFILQPVTPNEKVAVVITVTVWPVFAELGETETVTACETPADST